MKEDTIEQCQKCKFNEREIENIKKNIEEISLDMKIYQKETYGIKLDFGKFESYITSQFLHFTSKLDEIIVRIDRDKNEKKSNRISLLNHFMYPALCGGMMVYITYKLYN